MSPIAVRPQGPPQFCPECPPHPWVVLGSVIVDADGAITKIDNCDCRRIVFSLASRLVPCPSKVPTVTSIEPAALDAGVIDQRLTITGDNFEPGMIVDLGPGVTVTYPSPVTATQFPVNVTIDHTALATERYVILINPDCAMIRSDKKFSVTPAAPATPVAGSKASLARPRGVAKRSLPSKGRKKI